MEEFRSRMEKYGGWIGNILDVCPDATLSWLETQDPYTKVIAPIEATRTVKELEQVLRKLPEELVHRVNSPLVDALFKACVIAFSPQRSTGFENELTKQGVKLKPLSCFLNHMCRQGLIRALEFCEERGVVWTEEDTYTLGMITAIYNNQLEVVQWLSEKNQRKYLDKQHFVLNLYHGSYRALIISFVLLVRTKAISMIRWMMPFLSDYMIEEYLIQMCAVYDVAELVEVVFPFLREGGSGRCFFYQHLCRNDAIRCAKAVYELDSTFEFSAVDVMHEGRMKMFRWRMEETPNPFQKLKPVDLFIHVIRDPFVRPGWEQFDYILQRFPFSQQDKNLVLTEWTQSFACRETILYLLEHGFHTPEFLQILHSASDYFHMRFWRTVTKSDLEILFGYGVVADERIFIGAILGREVAQLVLDKGGPALLTRSVFEFLISNSQVMDEVVADWFLSRGFEVTEADVARASTVSVLQWCRTKNPNLTGHPAIRDWIANQELLKCERWIEAGFTPDESLIQYAKQVRNRHIIRCLEGAMVPEKRKLGNGTPSNT